MTAPYKIDRLTSQHDRASFTCGVEPIDRYLKNQASQDVKRRVAACFVAIEIATGAIGGYYTMCAAAIPLTQIGPDLAKKLPRYPVVPAARVGRLGVSTAHQGKGLGSALIVDAITRALRDDVMAFALLVDAKDDAAAEFYAHLGFLTFESQPRTLYLPLTDAARRFGLA